MMRPSAFEVIDQINVTGVVPLFTHENADEVFEVIQSAYKAGIRVFEVTNRKPNSFEVFSNIIQRVHELPGLLLGIGTVMDGPTTEKFIHAGAHFIISPILNLEMAEVCRENKIMWIPGCATTTEIITARQHGAVLIKVFPGSVLGPGFVSSVLSVAPDLQLMITGGVEPSEQNLRAWFSAGATCVGMGSHLFPKKQLAAKDWSSIEENILNTVSLIRKIRSSD